MGLTITSKIKDCKIHLDGGYSILHTIRIEVAKLYDEEFGQLYEEYFTNSMTKEECNLYISKMNELLKDDRFKDEDTDLLEFLFASDCEGKIGYKTCKKVYDLLKDSTCNYCLRYAFYSNNDWDDLRELLLQCYKHRANLIWN